jgi:hypothetical protein
MGWSCRKDAMDSLDAIQRHMDKVNNTMQCVIYQDGVKVGFWEPSNVEHDDGAITGTVNRYLSGGFCRPAGSFRIEGNGRITRFPLLPKAVKDEINFQVDEPKVSLFTL